MPKKYTPNCSKQVSRQIKRNPQKNLPRLNKLKECIGCMQCGKCDIPGKYLDGHHVDETRNSERWPILWIAVGCGWSGRFSESPGTNRMEAARSNSSANAIMKSATRSARIPRHAWNLKTKAFLSLGASTAATRGVRTLNTKKQNETDTHSHLHSGGNRIP